MCPPFLQSQAQPRERMNDDVLATIAAYGDADTRRSMGFQPQKLCRNPDSDEKLQAIHRLMQVCVTRGSVLESYQRWDIRLNRRFCASVGSCTGQSHYITYTFNNGSYFRTVRCGENQGDWSGVALEEPLAAGTTRILADLVNGKWVLKWHPIFDQRMRCDPAEFPALKRLGYVFPSPKKPI
jgi:hypothetical protein